MISARNTRDQPAIPLSGNIASFSVPWLFQEIRIRSKSGTAVVEYLQEKTAARITKKVYFEKGDVLFAASSLPEDRLSDQLHRAGKLTDAQYNALSELIEKTGKKQGAIIVQLGFLTPQQLVEAVKEQVKSIVLSLFSIRMGSYRFDEGKLPLDEIIPLQMSTGNITLESINSLDWQAIRKSLPDPTTVIRQATDPSCLFQSVQLSPDQQTVFDLVDGSRTIEQVCGLSGIGDFNALKAVYLLLALRMAEVGALKVAEAPEAAPKQAPVEALPELTVTRESILQAHAALANQTHYEVLGVSQAATAQQLKRYYFRLAKAYHPDRHFDPAMADLKPTLEALFSHIHNAYEILSSPEKRKEYDAALPTARPAPAQPPGGEFVEKRAEEYQENYAEKAARAAVQFEAGMKDFKIGNYWGAEEKFSWCCRMDPIKAPYFFYHGICLANIPRRKHEAEERFQKAIELDATKTEYHIELSNLYLKSGVKVKALAVLNNALGQVAWSDKIEEAIAAANEGRISAVMYGERPGAAESKGPVKAAHAVTKEKAAKAVEEFNRGMKEFRSNNFGLAVDPFAAAVRMDPTKAQYHFYYGVALSRTARRQLEAETPLLKALELDSSKVEHHLELGNFYIKTGQKAKALGVLKNALLRHPHAVKVQEAIKAISAAPR